MTTILESIHPTSRAVRERLDLEVGALEPTTSVVHLTPSYGADVLAVCGEVHVEGAG